MGFNRRFDLLNLVIQKANMLLQKLSDTGNLTRFTSVKVLLAHGLEFIQMPYQCPQLAPISIRRCPDRR